jgi:hypothetical protein
MMGDAAGETAPRAREETGIAGRRRGRVAAGAMIVGGAGGRAGGPGGVTTDAATLSHAGRAIREGARHTQASLPSGFLSRSGSCPSSMDWPPS